MPMKIAIASSGLGHVSRGIETWALDTACALATRGVDVTLFAGGEVARTEGAGPQPVVVPIRGMRRFEERTQRWVTRMPGAAWRLGLKDGYGWEQFSFWIGLQKHLRRGGFDILHVQDPLVAMWCHRWRKAGLLRTRPILAHGTEEPAEFLAPLEYVQHLAPWHLEEAMKSVKSMDTRQSMKSIKSKETEAATSGSSSLSPLSNSSILSVATPRPFWVAIPNFVDTDIFRPAVNAAERQAFRDQLGIPADALLVGCVAAVKKTHKRIDYLIDEFAQFMIPPSRRNHAHLVIAGARQPDSAELVALAKSLAPGRIHLLFDVGRESMPALYRALDVFVLASQFEMMPIALLEALASGVPALVHPHPVLEWIIGATHVPGVVGPGGRIVNMTETGTLAGSLGNLPADWLRKHGENARHQAATRFAVEAVIGEYMEYYRRVERA